MMCLFHCFWLWSLCCWQQVLDILVSGAVLSTRGNCRRGRPRCKNPLPPPPPPLLYIAVPSVWLVDVVTTCICCCRADCGGHLPAYVVLSSGAGGVVDDLLCFTPGRMMYAFRVRDASFIRKRPDLLLGSLSFLKNEPGLLDFENKRNLMRTLLSNPDEGTRNALNLVASVSTKNRGQRCIAGARLQLGETLSARRQGDEDDNFYCLCLVHSSITHGLKWPCCVFVGSVCR